MPLNLLESIIFMLIKNHTLPYSQRTISAIKFIFLFNLVILFVSSAVYRDWAKDFSYMALACSLFGLLIVGRPQLTKPILTFSLICFGLFTYTALLYFYHPYTIHTGPQLEVQTKLLLIIPIATLLYYTRASIELFAVFNLCLAITAGMVAIIFFDQKTPLPSFVQKQAFGNLSMLSAFVLLFFTVYSKNIMYKFIYFIAACFGAIASFWCDTRTGWVAMPFFLILLGSYTYKQHPQHKKVYILCSIACCMIILYFQDKLHIMEPLKLGLNNTIDYLSGKDMPAGGTSLGMRFEMWKAAFIAIQSNPFFGIGIGNVQQWIMGLIDQGIVSTELQAFRFKGFHNTFIGTLATLGLIGLVILLYLFYWLFCYFKKLTTQTSVEMIFLGYLGLLLIVAYSLYALTDDLFSSTMTMMYFIIYCTYIIYLSCTLNVNMNK